MGNRKTPKKPTEPFGYISFGKNGAVRKNVEKLSSVKSEQEAEISSRFSDFVARERRQSFSITLFEERDQDFLMQSTSESIIVQATEVVGRDYLRPLSNDDWVKGHHSFAEFVHEGPDSIFGVDREAKEDAIRDKIKKKLKKHYPKPKDRSFWLLIWTTRSDFLAFYSMEGRNHSSVGVARARAYLSRFGSGPFDEIWFFYVDLQPHRIWPV